MNPLAPAARSLFKVAMILFVVTIVIGILNGLDIWDPPRNLVMTHVHAGTLGWITLAVVAGAMLLFGEGADRDEVSKATNMGNAMIATTVLYVVAFAAGTGIYRPIAGTLMLVAIVWALIWATRRRGLVSSSVARLGAYLALVSLTIGAVLGVLLGLFIARGSLPGMDTEQAAALGAAHPAAILIGYLVLAGAAFAHWILDGKQNRLGSLVMWLLFIAGILANIAFIFDVEALIQVFSLIQVVAIVAFIVHMWSRISPATWGGGGSDNFGRMAVVFLVVGIGLLVYVVQLFVSGVLNPETGEGPVGVLIAFDHAMFIGVMTNVLFAVVARLGGGHADRLTLWAVNGGLVVFLLGLVIDTAALKRVGAPVMGIALLYGLFVYYRQLKPESLAEA